MVTTAKKFVPSPSPIMSFDACISLFQAVITTKKALIFKAFGVSVMVIRTGFEPATPTLSRWCSPN